jgi:hypothetical protein
MSKIIVSVSEMPFIEFDSNEWDSKDEYVNIANEIIRYIKKNNFEAYLVQNQSYSFGDTMVPPIIMVKKEDFGGTKETLELFIKDIVYDLIPDE